MAAAQAAAELRPSREQGQKRPRLAVAREGPSRSRERLSHKRSVVASDQRFVKTHKNTDIQPILTCRVICVTAPPQVPDVRTIN